MTRWQIRFEEGRAASYSINNANFHNFSYWKLDFRLIAEQYSLIQAAFDATDQMQINPDLPYIEKCSSLNLS